MRNTMLTTATQQRNSQGNLQGNPQSETPPISIEISPIAPIIDAARIFSLRFTARIKRIGAILIMSSLMVFLAACAGGGGGGGAPGGNGGDDDVVPPREDPISVSNLRVIPDTNNATLTWSNPNVNITQISIIYRNTAAGSVEKQINITAITDSNSIRPNANVTKMIPNLTNGANYTFNVALELGGADEGKSVMARKRTLLIGPNLDGDEYADTDPLELDEDGDNVNDDVDVFPRNATEDTDTDNDGVGNNTDAFPSDPNESVDTDGDGVGDNTDAFPTDDALSAFAVSELRATAGAGNVTISWNNPNNPDVRIASIDISYKRTGTNDAPMMISSSQITSGATNVEETITGLTNGQSYIFTVSLILRDTDASKEVEAQSVSATATTNPFAVTGLYGISGVDYVTLRWNNPDAQIESISISYQVSGTGNPEESSLITDSPKIDANEIVQHNISGLTEEESYDFTVSLILSGPDEGKEGAPPTIRNILVNDDYDGDGKNNFADVDANGNGLIEIATAQQLNQSRHNLLGTSFKSSAGGVGNANGCGNGTTVGEDVTACNGYELIADIYLATYTNWQPISRCPTLSGSGTCTPTTELFNAIFDGNNHTINDLTITNHDGSYDNAAGLFGAISSTSILRNIHIRSGNISGGGRNVGLLVGYARRAMIINSSAEGAVTASGNNAGGLVGFGRDSNITSSYAAGGAISGDDSVGGLVGFGERAEITSSYAAGGAISGDDSVGGLVGFGAGSRITSSYAAGGDVSGTGDRVGGLVGYGFLSIITSSYAAGGDVSGDSHVGGLVGGGGVNGNIRITSSYAAGGDVSGGASVGGLVGFGRDSTITSSYAAGGSVRGTGNSVGGLVGGGLGATITSSYAAGGSVSGSSDVGGLVGFGGRATITSSYAAGGAVIGTGASVGGLVGNGDTDTMTPNSYWDNSVTIMGPSDGGSYGLSQTTSALQTPTEATGIYSTWTTMCADGSDTWDFGTASQYPALNCTPNGFLPQRRQR